MSGRDGRVLVAGEGPRQRDVGCLMQSAVEHDGACRVGGADVW
jgi:hypothetical protein